MPKRSKNAEKKAAFDSARALPAPRIQKYLACELKGRRNDIGSRYKILYAQLAIALSGKDRDDVLKNLVELLATGIS